ncbi:ribonuclease E inhibitor RraB [Massilia glaciei]|uniref:Ribonuclease E inhibitor RraB n=1 Tax=Massilia glaciei TaxID=1524097 RepID=A0A2U2HJ67_9BURK|nr:ribonuclease E inhibitor RraB [Massilia glaciei]PWF47601.1 ribonuclease E inhibitor RraB [Massilia glaciei]
MKSTLLVSLVTVFLVTVIVPLAADAQAGGSRDELEQMFANISQKTKWDTSKSLLWGYFFTSPSRQPLEIASSDLSKLGYRVVQIYLSDKENSKDPDKWWLHVERVEIHSVTSLLKRNAELSAFAERHGLASYDGMDVGTAPAVKK